MSSGRQITRRRESNPILPSDYEVHRFDDPYVVVTAAFREAVDELGFDCCVNMVVYKPLEVLATSQEAYEVRR